MRILLLILLAVASCTQLKKVKTIDESQISPATRKVLEEARSYIKSSQSRLALTKLGDLDDAQLTPVEKALKYNLKGVSLFNIDEIEKAILNFEVSAKYAPKDTQLYSQVQLNMASGHYKLNQMNELKDRLNKIDRRNLSNDEVRKYAQLGLAYGNKVQDHKLIVSSSVLLLADAKTFSDIQNSNLYLPMKDSFSEMSQKQKIALLEDFNDSDILAVAALAQIEADSRYLDGDKSGAKDVISWLRSEFGRNDEVRKFVKEFELRLENSSRISTSNIGIVLPLTGDKAGFGQKALSGIDTGMKILSLNENVKLHTKDSADSPAQGAQAVLELIREEKVAFIIGGLFPETAKAEYLEARKYGVLFISLSQINLPKEEKNHNLIEVQGSIESQVEVLLSDNMIKKFGSRLGVIFPDNEAGKAYIDEIWRKANQKSLQITSVARYPKNTHDYRDTAQLFLGLKYPRERAEEFKILTDVYSMERTTIRRVQTLPPVMDFDWIFMASYPHEAAQLIPTLGYYDANRIKVVGGPSWVSKSMVKEQRNLGTLYFVGDDPKDINQEMLAQFQEIYGKPASLIEVMSFDAMKIGADVLLTSGDVSSRDDFDSRLKNKGSLKGLSTEWKFNDGIWMKDMNPMAITRGEIVKLFKTE
jgi:ABC-type branched-subunit amino acid transport system substrate-binding protein